MRHKNCYLFVVSCLVQTNNQRYPEHSIAETFNFLEFIFLIFERNIAFIVCLQHDGLQQKS